MKMRKIATLFGAMAALTFICAGCSDSTSSDSGSGDGEVGNYSGEGSEISVGTRSGIYAGSYLVDGASYSTLTLDGEADGGTATLSGGSSTLSGSYAQSGTRSARAATTLTGDYIVTFSNGTITMTIYASSIILSEGSLSADGAGTDTGGISTDRMTYYLRVDKDGKGGMQGFDSVYMKFMGDEGWQNYDNTKDPLEQQFQKYFSYYPDSGYSYYNYNAYPCEFFKANSINKKEGVYYIANDYDGNPLDRVVSEERPGFYRNVKVKVAFEYNNEIWIRGFWNNPLSFDSPDFKQYYLPVEVGEAIGTYDDGTTKYELKGSRSVDDIVQGARAYVTEVEIPSYLPTYIDGGYVGQWKHDGDSNNYYAQKYNTSTGEPETIWLINDPVHHPDDYRKIFQAMRSARRSYGIRQ